MDFFNQPDGSKPAKKKIMMKPKKKKHITKEKKFIPPKLCYWPRELTTGLSDYSIHELESLIQDSSWYAQKKNELEQSEYWKKLPKDEDKQKKRKKEMREIIFKQMKWEKEEFVILTKCNFFNIDYIVPKFPNNYETKNEKKRIFLLNYRWTSKTNTDYTDTWTDWMNYDELRRDCLNSQIKQKEEKYILDKRIERWEMLSEEQQQHIIKEEKDFRIKCAQERQSQSSKRAYINETETESTPNGMCVVRESWMTDEQWSQKRQELREAYRESLR